ncbi:MAG TPA: rhodanese-like domain-containing protein [bacterium]|nr:rhodanese-like domain-containing protein [bacterium]
MKNLWRDLTLTQKFGVVALMLGLLALIGGTPQRGSFYTIDSKAMLMDVAKETDHIAVETLADWIIQGRSDYRLLDIRDAKAFETYHIPSAESVPLAELHQAELRRNEKIIFYADGGIHASQAWFVLKARGYNGVYMLRGGLEEWQDRILYPHKPSTTDTESLRQFEKSAAVAKFFGGETQGEQSTAAVKSATTPLPKLPAGAKAAAPKTGKKKKEGC